MQINKSSDKNEHNFLKLFAGEKKCSKQIHHTKLIKTTSP